GRPGTAGAPREARRSGPGLRLVVPCDAQDDASASAAALGVRADAGGADGLCPEPLGESGLDAARELFCGLIEEAYAELRRRAEAGEGGAERWLARFLALGERLGVLVTAPPEAGADAAAAAAGLWKEGLARRRVPAATYRLQFNRDFTFYDAAGVVPYLHALGVSDCYASPVLQARGGSGHGYDVCDHSRLNPDLGGDEGFAALAAALQH